MAKPIEIHLHDIIDRENLVVAPGRVVGRSGTVDNARKALSRHLDGDLWNGPRNVAHLVDAETGEDHGWWFQCPGETARSRGTITLGLTIVRHEGAPLTVREPEATAEVAGG